MKIIVICWLGLNGFTLCGINAKSNIKELFLIPNPKEKSLLGSIPFLKTNLSLTS